MLLPVKSKTLVRIKDKIEANRIFLRSLAETIIRRAIIPSIALKFSKQKVCYSFDDFHANVCKYRGYCQNPSSPKACALNLLHNLIQGDKIHALINFKSEANIMTPTFIAKLGLII